MKKEEASMREADSDGDGVLISIANPTLFCSVWNQLVKKKYPVFRTWLFLGLFVVAFQAASAETALYFFKKTPADPFTVIEAVKEEKLSGFLKLTDKDGKIQAWQEAMLVGKFGLFDEAAGTPDQASLEGYISSLESFMAKEPASSSWLQPLVDKWKKFIVQTKIELEDDTRKKSEERLSRFLSEEYQSSQTYPVEALEAKVAEGGVVAGLLPDQGEKVAQYLKPWAEELKNRKAGLERFEGNWLSADAIAQVKADRVAAIRKNFLEQELAFRITNEALSQNAVYMSLAIVGASVIFFGVTLLGGLTGLVRKPGIVTWLAILTGGGGLAAYGLAVWLLLQNPSVDGGAAVASDQGAENGKTDAVALEDLIFSIHQPKGSNATEAPARVLIQDPSLNSFLKNYVKLDPASKPGDLSVIRKGVKVQVRDDRIVIVDELSWAEKDLVVCYTLYFIRTNEAFQFGKTEASVGNLPMPNRIFSHLWSQMGPLMQDVLNRSGVMENYYIKRMEPGLVEMVSKGNAPRQASR